jgi:hypothetical protein
VNEQAFLEQGGQRAVEIGGSGKFPEFFNQGGRRVSGAEEIGKHAETVGDLAPKCRVYTQIRSLIRHTGLLAGELPPSTSEVGGLLWPVRNSP